MFGHEKSGTLKKNEITPVLLESKDSSLNKDIKHDQRNENAYEDKQDTKRSKNTSGRKNRTSSTGGMSKLAETNLVNNKPKTKLPTNDFDPDTVKDGLDQIDYEIHDLDK